MSSLRRGDRSQRRRLAVGALVSVAAALFSVPAASALLEGLDLVPVGTPLSAGDEARRFGFRTAISADGSRVAVGSFDERDQQGVVRVYRWDSEIVQWVQLGADIAGPDQPGGPVNRAPEFAHALDVSADGAWVAIGVPGLDVDEEDEGAVSVYAWSGTAWIQVGADIVGGAPNEGFGASVAVSADGSRLVAGGVGEPSDGFDQGRVRVFDWDGATWEQVGDELEGTANEEQFGHTVAITDEGSRISVGAPFADGSERWFGRAAVFDWDGTTWTQAGDAVAGREQDAKLGWSLALSGDGSRLVAGESGLGEAIDGRARVFDWDGSAWIERPSLEGSGGDTAGWSVDVSADGSRVVVGAPQLLSFVDPANPGRVWIHDWIATSSSWTERQLDGASGGDAFGWSVAVSADGTHMIVGAPWHRQSGGPEPIGEATVYLATAAEAPNPPTTDAVPTPTLPATGDTTTVDGALSGLVLVISGLVLIATTRRTRRNDPVR